MGGTTPESGRRRSKRRPTEDDLREQEGQFNDLEPTRDVLRVLEVRRRWNYRLALLLFWSQNLESDCEASGDLCFQV